MCEIFIGNLDIFFVCIECFYMYNNILFLQQKRARKGKNWTQLEVCQKKSRGKHGTEILSKIHLHVFLYVYTYDRFLVMLVRWWEEGGRSHPMQ